MVDIPVLGAFPSRFPMPQDSPADRASTTIAAAALAAMRAPEAGAMTARGMRVQAVGVAEGEAEATAEEWACTASGSAVLEVT